VTNASGAHLRFQWPRAGSVLQTSCLLYEITQYYLPHDTSEPVLALCMGGGQTSHITAITFPTVKPVPSVLKVGGYK